MPSVTKKDQVKPKPKAKKTTTKTEPAKKGRPFKYTDPAEVQNIIDNYFAECDNHSVQVYDKKRGEVVSMKKPRPYTIEGICVALEIDRKTLLNYEKGEVLFHTIKKAKEKVLMNLSERALGGENTPAVSIFFLKNNFGFVDKTEVVSETTHNIKTFGDLYEDAE